MQSVRTKGKELTHDEVYQIMLRMDIDDIQVLCLTNKEYGKICSNDQFWMMLFKQHGLKIYNHQDSMTNWIKEYKKVFNATREADDLLRVIKTAKISYLYFPRYIPITMLKDGKYNSNLDLYMIQVDQYTDQALKELLTNVLYDYSFDKLYIAYRGLLIPLRKEQLMIERETVSPFTHFASSIYKEFYDLYYKNN